MIAVVNPTDSITAVMSGAAATTNPTYSVLYKGEGVTNQNTGSLSGATAVTLVAAPSANQRQVELIQIYNGDTSSVTVTVSKVVSGTSSTLIRYVIPVGYTLVWNRDSGPSLVASASASGAGTAGAGTTAVESGNGVLQRTVLTMSDVSVTVANTTGVSFGGTKIYDFPAGRILVLGVTAANISFDLTDAGNVTPITGTMGGDISIGTTVASDGTLTNADVDLLPSTSIDPISGGVAGAALAASAQFDGTGTAKDAFFNILIDDADVADTASDVLLVNGTVTITWINCGDY